MVHNFQFPLPGDVFFIPSDNNQSLFLKALSWSFSIKKENQTTIISDSDIQVRILLLLILLLLIEEQAALTLWTLMFQCFGGCCQCMEGGCDIWSSHDGFANPSSQSWFRSVLTVFRFYVFGCYMYCSIQWKVNVVFVCKESCSILWNKWLLIIYIHIVNAECRTFLVLSRSLLIMYTKSSIINVCVLQTRKCALKSVAKSYPVTQGQSCFKVLPCITFCACIMRKRAMLLAAR